MTEGTQQPWFVVITKPQAERQARHHLEEQDFDVFLPLVPEMRRHARATTVLMAPMFPTYLFARFARPQHRWRAILNTIGVQRLLYFGGEKPAMIRDAHVAELRRFVEQKQAEFDRRSALGANHLFKSGQRVRVTKGLLQGLEGLIYRASKDRIHVWLDMIGRSALCEFNPQHLEAMPAA